MGNYITQTILENAFSVAKVKQYTDDDGDGTADPAVLSQIITWAEGEVDAALTQAGYDIPISSPPAILVQMTTWLAVGNLYARRSRQPEGPWARNTSAARAWLMRVREGNEILPGVAPGGGGAGGLPVLGNVDFGFPATQGPIPGAHRYGTGSLPEWSDYIQEG